MIKENIFWEGGKAGQRSKNKNEPKDLRLRSQWLETVEGEEVVGMKLAASAEAVSWVVWVIVVKSLI